MSPAALFKTRLADRSPMLGAFIKTPHPIVIEIMGASGLDFLVLDAEHAPFDRSSLDACMIAGRAVGCPLIVRIPTAGEGWVLSVLDMGAAGIMVPHVMSREQAAELARATRYGAGGRGFAGTTRAADYARRSMAEHLDRTAGEVSLICQIEDPEGVDNCAEIADVPGVDALFVGRADLAVSYGVNDFFGREIAGRCNTVLGVKGSATGLYCAPGEDIAPFRDAGASLFVVGSEHTLMTQGVAALRRDFDG